MTKRFCLLIALLLLPWAVAAHASLTVLVGEPFGRFGTMMPVGHTAVYLDRLCADGPLRIRVCDRGEVPGVVVARYAALGKYDWIATPVTEFLYATEQMDDVPEYATPALVWRLREQYRERHLLAIVPDGQQGEFYGDGRATGAKDLKEWWETAGMAYNRRVWAYEISSTLEQDQAFVAMLNADSNRHRYRLRGSNCANFAADVVNFYFPGAVRSDRIADFGLMTPKQVARSVEDYAAHHPDLNFRVWEIPQVPGSLRRSRPVRGGAEAGLKTKRYLFTLLLIQPEVPLCLTVLYLQHGRWHLGDHAKPMPMLALSPRRERPAEQIALGASSTEAASTLTTGSDEDAPPSGFENEPMFLPLRR